MVWKIERGFVVFFVQHASLFIHTQFYGTRKRDGGTGNEANIFTFSALPSAGVMVAIMLISDMIAMERRLLL